MLSYLTKILRYRSYGAYGRPAPLTQIRLISDECKEQKQGCGIDAPPCDKNKKKPKKKGKKVPFKSMWENPECCVDICSDLPKCYDELYWNISDKSKRKYQQTWIECPKLQFIDKPLCCYDRVDLPHMEKRKRKPRTACEQKPVCTKVAGDCPRLKYSNCRVARIPPKCHNNRLARDCKKIKAPYPSFSECNRPCPRPRHPIECLCLRIMPWCEVWDYLRKRPELARQFKK